MTENKKINKKFATLFLLGGVLIISAGLFSLNLAEKVSGATGGGGAGGGGLDGGAQTVCPLTGWAWSGYNPVDSNGRPSGIGWVSFSGANYKVEVDSSNNLVGYAWASPGQDEDKGGNDSIGWIKFGGFNEFKNGNGQDLPNPGNARLDRETGKITGWARACVVFQSGCSGDLKSTTERGGWDGWISLDGSNYGIEWNSSNRRFEGHAWGSDKVIGWMSFAGANYGVTFTDPALCAPGNGGGAFDYSLSIGDLGLNAGTSGSISHPVLITKLSGDSERVDLIEVVRTTQILPNDVNLTVTIDPKKDSCTPSCDAGLIVDYNLESYQGGGIVVWYEVTSKSEKGLVEKQSFSIRINPAGAASCFPSRSFAAVGQEITWTANPGNLEPTGYSWSGSEGLSDTTNPIKITYTTAGIKTAQVTIFHGEDQQQTIQCLPSVQVFSEFEFEHL